MTIQTSMKVDMVAVAAAVAVALLIAPWSDAATPSAAEAASVYVMDNSDFYHRADCPRLRFGSPLAEAEAASGHRPCPVCRPGQPGELPRTAAIPPAAPAALAPSITPAAPTPAKTSRRGRYRWLGFAVGAGIGFIAGGAADVATCFSIGPERCNSGEETAVVLGLTAAGAIGGYAVAGGFARRSEDALERGREAVRAGRAPLGRAQDDAATAAEAWRSGAHPR